MKAKHTKLNKSIFLILICISLTTTFVVSASAAWSDSGYRYSFLIDNELVFSSSIYLDSHDPGGFMFYIVLVPPDLDSLPPGYYFISLYSFSNSDFSNSVFLGSSFDISNFSILDSNSESISFNFLGSGSMESVELSGYSFLVHSDITFIYNTSSPSFTDSVGTGLTSSLSWVGQVVESLTNGSIKPLLGCFAVTISVSAVLLGIYSIKRFIWGK